MIGKLVTFALSASSAFAQCGEETFKLLPDDGALNDVFGESVAISGTTAIVGAHGMGASVARGGNRGPVLIVY